MSCRTRVALSAASVGLFASISLAQVRVNLIAQVGQPLPVNAGTVTGLNTPVVNGLGQVGFSGAVNIGAGTTSFVFANDRVVHRNSDVVSPVLTGIEGTIGISNAGGFAISPTADGGDALYTNNGLVLNEGQPVPPFPGNNSVFNSRPTMSADGTAYWVAGFGPGTTTTQRALLRAAPGGSPITSVIAGGQTIGADTITQTGIEFPYDVSDNNAHYISRVTFTGPTATDAAVVRNGALVEREGSMPTGSTSPWQAFRFVGINNAGNYIVYGDDASAADDILVYNGAVIMRQGQTLAGLTLGTTLDAAAINNLDQIAQIWDSPGTGSPEALFFSSASNIASSLALLRTGDALDTTGDGVADFTLTDFNASSGISKPLDLGDTGVVYVDVDLTPIGGGTAVESIIAVAVPEPGMIGAIALAMTPLVRRRR